MILPGSLPFRKVVGLLLLMAALALGGCETSEPPVSSNGKKLKLEAVTHDGQTSYVYREVAD